MADSRRRRPDGCRNHCEFLGVGPTRWHPVATMLLRHMPDLSPTNTRYRAWFYSKWGLENCLILGNSRCAEYGPFRQRLSVKMATGGPERYFIGSRTLAVDDDSYLILNEGQVYGSAIRADREVESFSIFFRPGLVAEVQRA